MWISDKISAALVLAILGGFLACGGSSDDAADTPEKESGAWQEVLRLYEKTRQTGEAVPADAYEWMKQDLERVGDWEYRVLVVDSAAEAEIEERLNELGRDRWECFAALREAGSLHLLFKRPVESCVGMIPHNDLLKLLRGKKDDGETPAE